MPSDVQAGNHDEAEREQQRIDRASLGLQRSEGDVDEQQSIGCVHAQMHRLPEGGAQVAQPEVVARRGHQDRITRAPAPNGSNGKCPGLNPPPAKTL